MPGTEPRGRRLPDGRARMTLRPDLALIARTVTPGARVLDVGCGDGALMAALRDAKQVDARGLEIDPRNVAAAVGRSEEHTSELQSLMRISYAVFCLKKKKNTQR